MKKDNSNKDMNFRVGDRVRTRHGKGTVVEINRGISSSDDFLVEHDKWSDGHNGGFLAKEQHFDNHCWWFDSDDLEDLSHFPEIIISTDGKTTTAELTKNGKTVKTAEAYCHPSDKFHFDKGAELALNRLFNDVKIVKQKSYQIGDKIKIVDTWNPYTWENSDGLMDKWLGEIMTINKIEFNSYCMKEDKGEWSWNTHCIVGKVIK